MKYLKKILYAIAVLYVPCLLIFPLLINQSEYWWMLSYPLTLLMCLLMSLPFYLAFLQLCSFVSRIAEKKERSKGAKILDAICDAVALAIFLSLIAFSKLFTVTLGLAILLATLWAVRFAIFKRSFELPEFFKQKSFWISVVALFIAFLSVAALCRFIADSDKRLDDNIVIKRPTENLDDVVIERPAADLSDFEAIIAEEQSLEGFDLIRITTDTIDSPNHESSMLVIWYSCGTEGNTEEHSMLFKISYTDFLTLYGENDGYVVYNDTVTELYDALLTDISPDSLLILQKVIARDGLSPE